MFFFSFNLEKKIKAWYLERDICTLRATIHMNVRAPDIQPRPLAGSGECGGTKRRKIWPSVPGDAKSPIITSKPGYSVACSGQERRYENEICLMVSY